MKPAINNFHGSAERSAFSWHLGELLAQDSKTTTINDDEERERKRKANFPALAPYLTLEELEAQEKRNVEGATYLLSVLNWNAKTHNCVAFYIPRAFRSTYQRRFESMTKDSFWYLEINIKRAGSRHRLALVPLPSFMGQTAIDDDKLSSKRGISCCISLP